MSRDSPSFSHCHYRGMGIKDLDYDTYFYVALGNANYVLKLVRNND